MIRIDDERGEMWCSSSILSFLELGWEREARRAAALRASLFTSFESGPNPACTSNSGSFPGIGEKVMKERSEKRFLHHFLRGRRGDWDEMPEGERRYVMLGSRKPEFVHHFFT